MVKPRQLRTDGGWLKGYLIMLGAVLGCAAWAVIAVSVGAEGGAAFGVGGAMVALYIGRKFARWMQTWCAGPQSWIRNAVALGLILGPAAGTLAFCIRGVSSQPELAVLILAIGVSTPLTVLEVFRFSFHDR